MTNYGKLYWLTRLDGLNSMAEVCSYLIGIALVFTIIFYCVTKIEGDASYYNPLGKANNVLIPILVFSTLIQVFLPTKNEAMFIIAGGKAVNFIEKDTSINNIPEQTTAIITKYLDNTLKELDNK